MAEKYDPVPHLAELVRAAFDYNTADANHYAERIAEYLGLIEFEDDEDGRPCPLVAGTVAEALRKALGLAPDEACELVSLRDGTPCTEPAVTRLTGACLHGHVMERWACEGHRPPGDPLWCRACYQLDAAHKCPIALFPAGAGAVTP